MNAGTTSNILLSRSGKYRRATILLLLNLAIVATVMSPWLTGPAEAAPPCRIAAEPQPVIAELPWAQRWLQPDRVWPLTGGRGVTVAVVDSGVDVTHPQLRGTQALPGMDLVSGTPGG